MWTAIKKETQFDLHLHLHSCMHIYKHVHKHTSHTLQVQVQVGKNGDGTWITKYDCWKICMFIKETLKRISPRQLCSHKRKYFKGWQHLWTEYLEGWHAISHMINEEEHIQKWWTSDVGVLSWSFLLGHLQFGQFWNKDLIGESRHIDDSSRY